MFERMRYALSRSHSAACVMPYSSRAASAKSDRARSMTISHLRKIGSSGLDRVDDSSSWELGQARCKIRQTGRGGWFAPLPGYFRRVIELGARTNREDGRMTEMCCKTAMASAASFGSLDDDEALAGKDTAAISAKNSVGNPESPPGGDDPDHHEHS